MALTTTIRSLPGLAGQDLEPSGWIEIDQTMIDGFARLTGDRQWIHTDPVRTAAAGHATLAHGFLVLSLIPSLSDPMLTVSDQARALNYGLNRVRFTAGVPCGSRLRLHRRLAAIEARGETGVLVTNLYTVEMQGSDRPALVAENLVLHEAA